MSEENEPQCVTWIGEEFLKYVVVEKRFPETEELGEILETFHLFSADEQDLIIESLFSIMIYLGQINSAAIEAVKELSEELLK